MGIGRHQMLFAHIRANFEASFYPRLSEWVAAFVTLMAGWVLTQNTGLMANTVHGYRLMLEMAQQPTWATVCILLGFTRLLILLINGAFKKSPHLRMMSSSACCFLWFSIFLSVKESFGLGMVMSGGFLVMDLFNIFRAAKDARVVDDALRRIARGQSA